MELEFLKSLVLIFGVSAIVVFALGRLRIPSIVGFLVAGIILGPHGFQFIKDVHEVELLAEIGVILLMFTIGLEFSLRNLMMLRTQVLGGGITQVTLTVIAVAIMSCLCLNQRVNAALFDGFLIALSSTAIVIKLLMDRAEINSPQGRTSVGILLFQDLCVVPFMLLIPILSGNSGSLQNIALTMLKSFALLGIVLIAARWAVPFILHEIVKTKSRELFIITIILLCIGTAFFTSKLGLSLALGAFLAGLVISESEYAFQAIADIMPFKESFIGLFFISIGMLMNISFLRTNIITVLGAVFSIIIIKSSITALASLVTGQPLRISILSGLYLSQIGEFSFVLALAGKKAGLLEEYGYQTFLSASVITMLLTPFIIIVSPLTSEYLISTLPLKSFERIRRKRMKEETPVKKSNHVIIIGFGVNGRNLAKVLRESGVPYVVLEMNANTVKKMKKKGEPIYYGDGTSREILHKLGIKRAKALVIAISDPAGTRRIVQIARQENLEIHIIVRTRYVAEVDDLIRLGANEVIPEEFETSIEIFSRVLHHYHVPRNVIMEHIEKIRQNSYSVLRNIELPKKHLAERYEFLKDIETEIYLIKEGSHISDHSIKELHLRAETGVTIIAVQRGDEIHQNPSPEFILKTGDVLLLIGKKKDINNAIEYLESERFLVTRYHR